MYFKDFNLVHLVLPGGEHSAAFQSRVCKMSIAVVGSHLQKPRSICLKLILTGGSFLWKIFYKVDDPQCVSDFHEKSEAKDFR